MLLHRLVDTGFQARWSRQVLDGTLHGQALQTTRRGWQDNPDLAQRTLVSLNAAGPLVQRTAQAGLVVVDGALAVPVNAAAASVAVLTGLVGLAFGTLEASLAPGRRTERASHAAQLGAHLGFEGVRTLYIWSLCAGLAACLLVATASDLPAALIRPFVALAPTRGRTVVEFAPFDPDRRTFAAPLSPAQRVGPAPVQPTDPAICLGAAAAGPARPQAAVAPSPQVLAPIVLPADAGMAVKLQLGLTVAQALPMLATMVLVARPAPGLAEDAPESAENLPPQSDTLERQRALVVTRALMSRPGVGRALQEHSNAQWLAPGFQLVLGAGFFSMYQHAGVMRALVGAGLGPRIREICGLSSGAIAGALYTCLGAEGLTQSVLELSLLDFLDLSTPSFVGQGALCKGRAVEAKIARDTSQFGCRNIEDVPGPPLRVAVFNGFTGKTEWQARGPLAQSVARSAALPVLFANEGFLDGGWVDHHGYTALRPNERALLLRVNTVLKPDKMQQLVRRPEALFNVSQDPAHKTVALMPKENVRPNSFLFDIDFRKAKLSGIVQDSEALFRWWLAQPSGTPLAA